ncbi:hypothetical protein [Limnohabitans sp.]|jgi:hypothetical protein|uniref:hypothetical protein n=1 Tax=Limnohabitans sp. TaxID=1907725 RepID=UPI0037C0036D
MKFKSLPSFIFMAVISSSVYSQELPECKDLEGKWTGAKVGAGYQGDISIVFDANCKYEWIGSAGSITTGKLDKKRRNTGTTIKRAPEAKSSLMTGS